MSNFLIKSLNLGVIDGALNWLIEAITTLLMWIVNWTIDTVVLLLCELLYRIGLTLLSLVDFFQAFFNALCGMGTYWDTSSGKAIQHTNEDPILSLITNKAVLQVFIALAIVAVIMLIMTTIVAMIRSEYTTEGAKNSKGNIIGSALKSLAMFFLVPAFCVFGIILSNALLQMVYIATTGGDNVSAGAMVWYASSYDANKVRTDEEFYDEHWGTTNSSDKYSADFQVSVSGTGKREEVALMIDRYFRDREPIVNSSFKDGLIGGVGSEAGSIEDIMSGGNSSTYGGYYSYRNITLTKEYYRLRDMNYIIMYLGGGIAVYIMFIAAFGLIIRLYKCTIIFMLSAPVSALTPLDGGSAFKNWRKLMVGSVCAAFSVVIAFNLVFLLIPVMSNIQIFNPNALNAGYWNRLVNMIFVLSGLYTIKETSKWVANMLGIEDPLASGSEIASKVMGTVTKVATTAGSFGVATAANLVRTGAGVSSKIDLWRANRKGNDDPNKARLQIRSQRLNSFSERAGGFAGKVGGVGSGIIQKSINKQMSRFDDFTGGNNIFGGVDEKGKATGLGKFMADGTGKLYDAATSPVSSMLSGAGKIRGAMNARDDYDSHMQAYQALQDRINRGENLSAEDKQRYIQYRDEARTGLTRDMIKNGVDPNNDFGGTEKAGLQFAGFLNASQYWGKKTDESAAFQDTYGKAVEKSNNVSKNVDEAKAAADRHGGIDTAEGREAATAAAEEIAKALRLEVSDVFDMLKTETGRNDLKAAGSKEMNILADYHFKHDVNISGFDPSSIPFESDEDSRTISEFLKANGMGGNTLNDQIGSVINTIKAERQKAETEARKESDKINQLAAAIAKMSKKLNPAKK